MVAVECEDIAGKQLAVHIPSSLKPWEPYKTVPLLSGPDNPTCTNQPFFSQPLTTLQTSPSSLRPGLTTLHVQTSPCSLKPWQLYKPAPLLSGPNNPTCTNQLLFSQALTTLHVQTSPSFLKPWQPYMYTPAPLLSSPDNPTCTNQPLFSQVLTTLQTSPSSLRSW